MFAKRAMVAVAATLALLMGALAPTSAAQDGGDPPPPPVVGNTTFPTAGSFPDLVYLQMTFANSPQASCTGTLVHAMWVLTAAHCVETDTGEYATEIYLMIGSVDIVNDIGNPPAGVEERNSNGFIIHGDYNSFTFENDVALVKLDQPSANTPRAIATTAALVNPANGNHTDARVYGYGQICSDGNCVPDGQGGFNSTDFRLRQGETEIRSDADAEAFAGSFPNNLEDVTFFTIPDTTVHGALCFGDSGGPTMIMDGGTWKVAGVNSHIFTGTGGFCDAIQGTSYVNGLADITSSVLADWVSQIVNGVNKSCLGMTTTLVGTTYNDKLIGTEGVDSLHGDRGFDELVGRGSGDKLCGGKNGDFILGGFGDDDIKGHSGLDVIFGNAGNDTIDGGTHADLITGGSGADSIVGGSGPDIIDGNGGADDIAGNSGHDIITGGKSGDIITGGKGDDDIRGNSGKDTISGNSGDDFIHGGSAGDTISGGTGIDDCRGGTGANTITSCE